MVEAGRTGFAASEGGIALKDQYVNIENLKIRYWNAGSSQSCVILIHGLGGYVENWEKNIASLSKNHRVFALDLPGFGRSDKPNDRFSISYWAAFLQKFMRTLEIERAALVGASMGGAIALQFALRYPQQVESLILSGSAGLGYEVTPFLRLVAVPILGERLSRPSRAGSGQFWKEIVHDQRLITDPLVDLDFELSSLPGSQQSFLKALRTLVNTWGGKKDSIRPILDHLEEILSPTLILWGAQDRFLPVTHAHNAVKRIRNASLHIFDPCGHLPNYERADEFNSMVVDFLA